MGGGGIKITGGKGYYINAISTISVGNHNVEKSYISVRNFRRKFNGWMLLVKKCDEFV